MRSLAEVSARQERDKENSQMVKYVVIGLLVCGVIIILSGLLLGLSEVRKKQKENDKIGGL